MKVVINSCYGGFGLSRKAQEEYLRLNGKKAYFYNQDKMKWKDGVDSFVRTSNDYDFTFMYYTFTEDQGDSFSVFPGKDYFCDFDLKRNDPLLIKVVETLGAEANGKYSKLTIVDVPDDVKWIIEDYDGLETVSEVHRSWS